MDCAEAQDRTAADADVRSTSTVCIDIRRLHQTDRRQNHDQWMRTRLLTARVPAVMIEPNVWLVSSHNVYRTS